MAKTPTPAPQDDDLGDNTGDFGGGLTTEAQAQAEAEAEAEAAAKAEAEAAAKAEAEAAAKPKPKAAPRAAKGMPKKVRIQLEESDEIPPTGLFIGLNGRGYLLKAGEPVDVPVGVMDILQNAVMAAPVVDPQTRQVIGYRDRMRYPFRKL